MAPRITRQPNWGLRPERLGRCLGSLLSSWLPALDGVASKLEHGAKVADVGCGFGAATLLLARAFPRSTFIGFDSDAASIALAREFARDETLVHRARFELAPATEFPGSGYDLVLHLESLHEAADPIGAARHVRRTLAPAGTWMLVVRLALAAEAHEARWRKVAIDGGFTRFRRATATASNLVFEARA